MDLIQLSLDNAPFAVKLQQQLEQHANCSVLTVKSPDLSRKGLIVIDQRMVDALPLPLSEPERFVLVTHNESPNLRRAWEQGIVSVVFESDPPHTICLAIQAALLRLQKTASKSKACAVSPKPGVVSPGIASTAPATSTSSAIVLKNQHL